LGDRVGIQQQLCEEDTCGTNSLRWLGLKNPFKDCLPILRNVRPMSVYGCKASFEHCTATHPERTLAPVDYAFDRKVGRLIPT
jgi:hypothetical protein